MVINHPGTVEHMNRFDACAGKLLQQGKDQMP